MEDDFLLIVATNAVGAMAVFVLWGFSSIFLHEFGHTLAAKMLGLNPKRMIVGECDPFFTRTILGVELELRMVPFGGLTIVGAPPTHRWKALLLVIAGPLANVFILYCAFKAWPYTSMKGILAMIILVEIMTVIVNLVPRNLTYSGRKYASDGKLLLQILFGRPNR